MGLTLKGHMVEGLKRISLFIFRNLRTRLLALQLLELEVRSHNQIQLRLDLRVVAVISHRRSIGILVPD